MYASDLCQGFYPFCSAFSSFHNDFLSGIGKNLLRFSAFF